MAKKAKFEVAVKRTEWGRIEIETDDEAEILELSEKGYSDGKVVWGKEKLEVHGWSRT